MIELRNQAELSQLYAVEDTTSVHSFLFDEGEEINYCALADKVFFDTQNPILVIAYRLQTASHRFSPFAHLLRREDGLDGELIQENIESGVNGTTRVGALRISEASKDHVLSVMVRHSTSSFILCGSCANAGKSFEKLLTSKIHPILERTRVQECCKLCLELECAFIHAICGCDGVSISRIDRDKLHEPK